ncbi:MAG: dienelactone hydrolase family protein [Armatimonadetes bacterium]|nr:dienelactone hydrolase family protein [Armatimonadota bacterium]
MRLWPFALLEVSLLASSFSAAESLYVEMTLSPAAAGRQLVRVSIPLPPGMLDREASLSASDGMREFPAAVRPLTRHAGEGNTPGSVRRAMVTFPYTFASKKPARFVFRPGPAPRRKGDFPAEIAVRGETVTIACRNGPTLTARLLAPPRAASGQAEQPEVVEDTPYYSWRRIRLPDRDYPRIIEVRADALGGVTLIAHLQRNLSGNGYAPALGWEVSGFRQGRLLSAGKSAKAHSFGAGEPCVFRIAEGDIRIYHPAAPLKRKGRAEIGGERPAYRYWRCQLEDRVPMQEAAWQRAEIVIAPARLAPLTATLESPHRWWVDGALWDRLYGIGLAAALTDQPELSALLDYHRQAVVKSQAVGDDWGNITDYADRRSSGSVYGMNRLNHGPAIFEEGYRSGSQALLEAGVLWCDNFYDQSIWWGSPGTGGTRYNNLLAMNQKPPDGDRSYMWRSNSAVDFCTKGYDAFLYAYEQTGDPRMKEALEAQATYAAPQVHADRGECRNIGDVKDFLRLYRFTGEARYREEALRLFRELRAKLSPGGLFSQGGSPIAPDPPYIEDDEFGYRHPFAKPYIIGYALAGLPELLRYYPEEPRLREVVQAVADFLADSQDPAGGWRYPHPRSSGLVFSQAMEHAWQIVQADQALGPQPKHLDAIERALRQRVQGWLKTGKVLSGLAGWELSTGRIKESKELYELYKKPEDRDRARDYTEGQVGLGGSPPEGLIYFPEVLAFYLKHRPASRLLEPPSSDGPLGQVLARIPASPPRIATGPTPPFQSPGVEDNLPVFRDRLAGRLTFPLSWLSGKYKDFDVWRKAARAKAMACLLARPPVAPFSPVVIAREDRGSYEARKVVFSLTADSRVLGLMLVPKGKGPFPAVLLLHDHGARFDIGKEKVIRPWDAPPEKIASAREWVEECYGGRFIGDELAKRGYICFAADALNWSDRGGAGYEGQQALAGNLFHLGMSFAGLIAHEDIRAAEFLATRPEVDSKRVAAMGLSMGSFRTWQVAALSDQIAAGVAICWMTTVKGLMVPGNNQTRGQSAYSMTHPGLFNYLDYPDVASLACPKPMLFYNGEQDGLFPVPAVREAYARMRRVWDSQKAGRRLETRLWNLPHVFSREMQEAAFDWLDSFLKPGG